MGDKNSEKTRRDFLKKSVTGIAGMAEIKRIGDFGNILPNQLRIAAETVTGKNQHSAAYALMAAIRALYLHTAYAPIRVGE